jgi:hypothetical protein
MAPGRSDGLREFAGRATGSSSKPQPFSDLKLLLPCSSAIAPRDSWHGDFPAVFGASHTWTLQKTLQTGVTSKSKLSAKVHTPLACEEILALIFMKSGYASKATASNVTRTHATRTTLHEPGMQRTRSSKLVHAGSVFARRWWDSGTPIRDQNTRPAARRCCHSSAYGLRRFIRC